MVGTQVIAAVRARVPLRVEAKVLEATVEVVKGGAPFKRKAAEGEAARPKQAGETPRGGGGLVRQVRVPARPLEEVVEPPVAEPPLPLLLVVPVGAWRLWLAAKDPGHVLPLAAPVRGAASAPPRVA